MSGIVLNEQLINVKDIQTKQIKISRCNHVNNGTRIWFQILTSDGEMFQRWAMNMNSTDETLLLMQPDDSLEITYIEDKVEDPTFNTFVPFTRNVILTAKFKK